MTEDAAFYAGRRVLVTGGTGLIGSHVVEQLAALGAEVTASTHRTRPSVHHPRITYVSADLSDLRQAEAVCRGHSAVFICSGIVGGAGLIGSATASTTRTLVLGTQVMEAAATAGVERVGLVSSTTIYPLSDHPLHEDEGFSGEPPAAYAGLGWCNRALEKVGTYLHAQGAFKLAIVRPTAVYGPRDRFNQPHAHVIPALIARAEGREAPFVVWGDGTAIRDFIHVADVARGLIRALYLADDATPINLGTGEAVTIDALVRCILRLSGHAQPDLFFDAAKPTTIGMRCINVNRSRERLGFTPQYTLESGLRHTLDWYRVAFPCSAMLLRDTTNTPQTS